MAFTSADVAAIEAAIVSLATSGVKQVMINGRSYTKYDIKDLMDLRDTMRAEVSSASYGATVPVKFNEVSG